MPIILLYTMFISQHQVMELATGAGIKPQHLKSHIDMLIEMGKSRNAH